MTQLGSTSILVTFVLVLVTATARFDEVGEVLSTRLHIIALDSYFLSSLF